ncbi:hypothetical protein PHK61_26890 [Actinomycetospora lutea]|uniref:hypothetical protein n=1 Tax=Actinomycetospora lutea TaxID=663604 RepID=UPI0023655F0B|nr:hypothetical protein [Actinomycetospora lutea]MDD7942048.1 hypothetical protein [Actinomycetospora lutea]
MRAGLAAAAGGGRDGWSVAGVVQHVHRQVILHGAEIALLRDLHALRARERNGSP